MFNLDNIQMYEESLTRIIEAPRLKWINLTELCLYIPVSRWNQTLKHLQGFKITKEKYPMLNKILVVCDAVPGYTPEFPIVVDFLQSTSFYVKHYVIDASTNLLVEVGQGIPERGGVIPNPVQ
ncbi:hypothetical protein NEOKW01_0983 [Nematocida sp. AWRm80]|nr:hypothetical protein NEOKW01_0983 [Nematocida sp. AWRm80]